MPAGLLRRHDVVRRHGLEAIFAGEIGGVGEPREALDEPERVAAFLAGILKNTGHARGAEGFEELTPLARIPGPARHAHLLAQVRQLRIRRTASSEGGELRAIQSRAGRKAVALEHERFRVQLEAVLEVTRAGLEHG